MNLAPPSEHHVLVFFAALLVLFVVARGLGALFTSFGQPAVIGELGAGIVLGPSLLGRVAPGVTDWLFPTDEVQTAMLFTVGWIGVVFLLVSTGAETDLRLIRRLGRTAAIVSVTSLVVPLAVGFGTGLVVPPELMADPSQRTVFALFLAAALSISSLPVMAKILGEMRLLRRDFAQLTLAAGMVNDVVGWVILGAIAGLAQAGRFEIAGLVMTVLGVAAFFAASFTIGQRTLDTGLRRIRREGGGEVGSMTVVLGVVLTLSVATQWLGVEAVLGAFVAGILLGRSPYADPAMLHGLGTVTTSFFAPVFFATAGLRVDLGLLADPIVAGWAVIVVVVASAAKFGGAFVGGRAAGLGTRESSALSIGLNARGALEIVIATIGLAVGVLNAESYTVVVVMAIVTSVMAPPLLRRVLAGWTGTPAERARLEQEEVQRTNRVVRGGRILIPSVGSESSIMAAEIVDLVWPGEVEATILTIEGDGHDLRPVVDTFADRRVQVRSVSSDSIASAVAVEARLGYGAIAVGAPSLAPEHLLSPLVDELLADHAVPLVVVRKGRTIEDGRLPWAYARAIVPVTGTASAQAAQEVAFGISSRLGTEIVLTHVLEPARALVRADRAGSDPTGAIADELLAQAEVVGLQARARTTRAVCTGGSVANEICELARRTEADLVVVGASKRRSERLFLGHTVQQILEVCDATVVVVVVPDANGSGGQPRKRP